MRTGALGQRPNTGFPFCPSRERLCGHSLWKTTYFFCKCQRKHTVDRLNPQPA